MGFTTSKPTKPLKCPRCESTNTKFCYYNNYNKSQPRHFCKSCKRHWTQGGLLRDVPVGGSRKNKLKITSSSRDDSEAGWIRCGGEGSTLITPRPFNPCSANKWHHHKGKNKLKITSSSRDGNEAGWIRCRDQDLTLNPKPFNPHSANKWHHHKGKNKLKITSSSRDGNEVGWNKCGDQDLTLAPRLFNPRSANKWHHHKGKNKLKITSSSSDDNETEWIRCGDQDLTLTSKHFNPHPANKWHQNKLKITSSSRADNEVGWNKCGDQGLTLTSKLFNLSCRAPPTSGITKEKSQMNVVQIKENYDQNSMENIFDNFLSTSLSYDNMFKGSIGTIPSSNIPTSSATSSNIYNYMGNIDSTMEEESTITWQGPIRSSVMDNLSNYSNWDDIETLVSANDFDM